jgi:hypothetical protein
MLSCTLSSHLCLREPIMLLKKSRSHNTLSTISHIIGPCRQGCDRSGMEVYNQTFLNREKKCLVEYSHSTFIPPLFTFERMGFDRKREKRKKKRQIIKKY